MPWHNVWFGWQGWVMMVVMLLFWVLVILGGVYLLRGLVTGRGVTPSAPGERTPLDTLNERYARGEITRDQYLQMRQDMGA